MEQNEKGAGEVTGVSAKVEPTYKVEIQKTIDPRTHLISVADTSSGCFALRDLGCVEVDEDGVPSKVTLDGMGIGAALAACKFLDELRSQAERKHDSKYDGDWDVADPLSRGFASFRRVAGQTVTAVSYETGKALRGPTSLAYARKMIDLGEWTRIETPKVAASPADESAQDGGRNYDGDWTPTHQASVFFYRVAGESVEPRLFETGRVQPFPPPFSHAKEMIDSGRWERVDRRAGEARDLQTLAR